MEALKIALLGAPGSGVGRLANDLQAAVKAAQCRTDVDILAGAADTKTMLAGVDLVLLMGLELPANSAASATPALQLLEESADQSLRQTLADAALPYQVLYGTAQERLAHAIRAIESLLPRSHAWPQGGPAASCNAKSQAWVWMCDKCSDPVCEHRLLTSLLAQRAGKAAA